MEQPNVDVSLDGSGRVIVVGELDLGSSSRFAAVLRRQCDGDRAPVRLDLGGVTFIDCAGLRPLIEVALSGAPVLIEASSGAVQQLISATHTDRLFTAQQAARAD